MNVITDHATLKTLYNADFKVIVPAIDLPLVLGLCRLSSSVALYVCDRGSHTGEFEMLRCGTQHGGARIPVAEPPTFCLAMLACSAPGKKQLEAMREVWSAGAEGFLPGAILIDVSSGADAATAQVYGLLFDSMAGLHAASAGRLLMLQRQYTAFRIVHDQLQNAFDTVENYLARSQVAPTWLAFACEPTTSSIGPQKRPDPAFQVTQLLPLPSQGLAALELHAHSAGGEAEGFLALSMTTSEERRTLGEWQIPYSAVPDGWMFLDLPEIDIASRQSVLLTATWNTQSGEPPKLSLTQLQPVPESCVRVAGEDCRDRSLALRLHIGLPGSRRVAHPYHIGVRRQRESALGRRLAPSVLRRFAELAPRGAEPRVRLIDDAAIEMRPVNGGTTVVKLPGALPSRSRRLSATIRTEDPAGPLVEYALLALAPRTAYKQVLAKGRLNGREGGFSGWLSVDPDFATQIHLTLPEPATRPLDLYLATRFAEGQGDETAPARWLDFVVDPFEEAMAS